MAGAVSEESEVGRSVEGNSSGHRSSQSGEALAEWRSSEQVENGTPSTSPPYWDTDDEEDGGPKPSELYGKYTWKIEKFSQLNKRELRSNAFEVGGYKWYILIYPQGCDVCNHLSLFLCVANHDKLLPGWSHFAQFTIAVVNKDPKKSKYSDTLHRFWKKEHDWGWKKFMELSKVLDGFIDVDTLIIKAQVQVIREKVDRPFRCLDCQYRRELVRVYLTNVEQICRRFVEERRSKLGKLIDDKARWSSFCAFWLGIDQNARCRMSRGKTDAILRVVVKHFFIEKEVTSTLVMDSLYSGLKALEGQMKCNKGRARLLDSEEMTAPIVRVEKDMFILVDDVLLLLERAAMEPLPPKDEKGPQNRTKDGSSGDDFNRDSIERDERRLTELGRRTVEIFVLAHIFSNKIEVAYQEAVALKRQEELIREEEAAWQMETEQKARRGTTEKEKKSKKKQAKQKRNNRKGKDRGKEEIRADMAAQDNQEEEGNPSDEKKDSLSDIVQPMLEKPDILEDVSDVSDSVDGVAELVPQSCLADREASPIQWDTDTSEIPLPTEANRSGIGGVPSSVQLVLSDKKCRSSPSPSPMDDSSSTCSTDSIPPVRMNGPHKGNAFLTTYRLQKSRGKGQTCNASCEGNNWVNQTEGRLSGPAADVVDPSDASGSSRPGKSESGSGVVKKEEEVVSLHKKAAISDQIDTERPVKEKTSVAPSSPQSPHVKLPSSIPHKSDNNQSGAIKDLSLVKKVILKSTHQTEKVVPVIPSSQIVASSKVDTQKAIATKPTEKPIQQLLPVMSRPSSAPLIPGAKPTVAPIVSMVQTAPLLARSMSAAGRLGPDPSSATHSYGPPQSYRNAIIGNNHVSATSAGFTTHPNSPILGGNNNTNNPSSPHSSASLMVSARMYIPQNSERLDPNSVKLSAVNPPPRNPSPAYSQASAPMFIPQIPEMSDPNTVKSSYPFGMVSPLHCCSPLRSSSQSFVPYKQLVHSGASEHLSQVLVDEFPHLDIINDLLDDEQHGMVNEPSTSSMNGGPRLLTRQFSLPGEIGMSGEMGSTNSSCRFERTHSYHDGGFERGYDHPSSSGQFENVMDYIPQGSPLPYMNGQIDGLIHNQWQIGSDLSVLGTRRSEYDGHPYFNPEYTNMVCGVNGYTIFRPSNGH